MKLTGREKESFILMDEIELEFSTQRSQPVISPKSNPSKHGSFDSMDKHAKARRYYPYRACWSSTLALHLGNWYRCFSTLADDMLSNETMQLCRSTAFPIFYYVNRKLFSSGVHLDLGQNWCLFFPIRIRSFLPIQTASNARSSHYLDDTGLKMGSVLGKWVLFERDVGAAPPNQHHGVACPQPRSNTCRPTGDGVYKWFFTVGNIEHETTPGENCDLMRQRLPYTVSVILNRQQFGSHAVTAKRSYAIGRPSVVFAYHSCKPDNCYVASWRLRL